MRSKSVKVARIRGYRAATVISCDKATTSIVFRNDRGNSTILKAFAVRLF